MPPLKRPRPENAATPVDGGVRVSPPSAVATAVATLLSVTGSLAADVILVSIGKRVFPGTVHYAHFRFGDYATLTVIGVLSACAAWTVVTRVSPTPHRTVRQLAVVVTLVLWIPDAVLLVRGQPARAVAVLMVMHLAIAVVTYTLLVRVAPVREAPALVGGPSERHADQTASVPAPDTWGSIGRIATGLCLLTAVELVLGAATLVVVPFGRPSGWLPDGQRMVYVAHALVGLPLTFGAVILVVRARGASRMAVLSSWIGCAGIAIAGIGGVLAVSHPLRLAGSGCMLVGTVAAGFGYLIPLLDRMEDAPPPVLE